MTLSLPLSLLHIHRGCFRLQETVGEVWHKWSAECRTKVQSSVLCYQCHQTGVRGHQVCVCVCVCVYVCVRVRVCVCVCVCVSVCE